MICAKSGPVRWWWADRSLPRDVAVVGAPYPADPRGVHILQPLYRLAPAAVFLGDMDPFSIVEYVEIRRLLLAATGRPLLYGGIDDAWLGASERSLKRGVRLAQVSIALSKREKALVKRLERAIDLERLVGRRAYSMLRSGYKVELEGATNPALYRRGHGRWVFRYLRSVVRRAAKGSGV